MQIEDEVGGIRQQKPYFYDQKPNNFLDGCHKYGWLITIIGTILFNIAFGIFMTGRFSQRVDDLEKYFGERIGRLEDQIDELSHITRGIPENQPLRKKQ